LATTRPTEGRAARNTQAPATRTAVLPIDEIQRSYPGEWVLVRVTHTEPGSGITHGEVLTHSETRHEVSAALLQAHRDDPTIHTYIGYGGLRLTPSDECPDDLGNVDSWLGVAAFELNALG
jgi:hypothetical protein